MAAVPDGEVYESMMGMLRTLRNEYQAELALISNSKEALSLAQSTMPLPQGIPEWLSPIVAIVAGQLFAHHLTAAKGYDTEHPRNIRKVTETH